jgi:hypothetical protein
MFSRQLRAISPIVVFGFVNYVTINSVLFMEGDRSHMLIGLCTHNTEQSFQ